ncbi:TerC family protein [Hazenella sp. IB182357]|uniref:TerC family protein n=1 Tax=Polycladospora coralii TaxID=2771432 RepID=A0A926NER6_9BACL|nr:TerC family protein [Polycladospora coralii]MBS7530703.1 TerC family protein [Polycladospora coralii]
MELLSTEFLTALLTIIVIDLVLAGDNAIVIGMAAKNLPKTKQKTVIIWGTVGAVVMRTILTLVVVWLLKIPYLLLIGGVLLLWIAYKLLADEKEHDVKAATSLRAAIQTIIVADTIMSLDNVLAVAGAAHNNYLLVILGLLISIPIIVWGSRLFLKLMDRFPVIIYIGSGVLAYTAAKMIVDEKLIHPFFNQNPWLEYAFYIIVVVAVLLAGKWSNMKKNNQQPAHTN